MSPSPLHPGHVRYDYDPNIPWHIQEDNLRKVTRICLRSCLDKTLEITALSGNKTAEEGSVTLFQRTQEADHGLRTRTATRDHNHIQAKCMTLVAPQVDGDSRTSVDVCWP